MLLLRCRTLFPSWHSCCRVKLFRAHHRGRKESPRHRGEPKNGRQQYSHRRKRTQRGSGGRPRQVPAHAL